MGFQPPHLPQFWKESDNELCQIEGCWCGENHGTDNETQDDEDKEEITTLEVGRHHESLDQLNSQTK